MTFDWSQTTAAYIAMTSNFVLNNQLTYRDRRLQGDFSVERFANVLRRLQRRNSCQCRGGELDIWEPTKLVACGHGRGPDGPRL